VTSSLPLASTPTPAVLKALSARCVSSFLQLSLSDRLLSCLHTNASDPPVQDPIAVDPPQHRCCSAHLRPVLRFRLLLVEVSLFSRVSFSWHSLTLHPLFTALETALSVPRWATRALMTLRLLADLASNAQPLPPFPSALPLPPPPLFAPVSVAPVTSTRSPSAPLPTPPAPLPVLAVSSASTPPYALFHSSSMSPYPIKSSNRAMLILFFLFSLFFLLPRHYSPTWSNAVPALPTVEWTVPRSLAPVRLAVLPARFVFLPFLPFPPPPRLCASATVSQHTDTLPCSCSARSGPATRATATRRLPTPASPKHSLLPLPSPPFTTSSRPFLHTPSFVFPLYPRRASLRPHLPPFSSRTSPLFYGRTLL
jgi:hypothetical protein